MKIVARPLLSDSDLADAIATSTSDRLEVIFGDHCERAERLLVRAVVDTVLGCLRFDFAVHLNAERSAP